VKALRSFEDLDVWKVGRDLRKHLYRVADRLPEKERYNLAAQIRSAAVSLTANVAEGFGRFHFKENTRFCRMARGSAYELLDHLISLRAKIKTTSTNRTFRNCAVSFHGSHSY
jgi:four helix bundle protein